MDDFDDFKPLPLPAKLFAYALGRGDGTAGIACISGDAGGFSSIGHPLSREDLRSAIASCLEQEECARSDDVQRLRAQCDSDEAIDEIAAEHRRMFADWCAAARELD